MQGAMRCSPWSASPARTTIDAPNLHDQSAPRSLSPANGDGAGNGFAGTNSAGAAPLNNSRSPRPGNRYELRGRRGDRSASPVILDASKSGELRARLLEELAAVSSPELATNWACNAITAKNTLRVPDAQAVEDAFERRVAELGEAAEAWATALKTDPDPRVQMRMPGRPGQLAHDIPRSSCCPDGHVYTVPLSRNSVSSPVSCSKARRIIGLSTNRTSPACNSAWSSSIRELRPIVYTSIALCLTGRRSKFMPSPDRLMCRPMTR